MISAKVIQDSKHRDTGTRLTTFEVVVNRYVLSEVNTHKMVSKNSASSRAVPIKSNIEYILNDTAYPISWGKNQAGMVADEDVSDEIATKAKEIWTNARDSAIKYAQELSDLGIHKQLANRLIENFSYQKIVMSGTEWDNFFWLRLHKDAQPEIRELARVMLEAYNESIPEVLDIGEWHVPYVTRIRGSDGILRYYDINSDELIIEDAIQISASCCAQTSYRKSDETLDKATIVFDRLNLSREEDDVRKHSSPVEHIGTPIDYTNNSLESPITHMDSNGQAWSANFKDFIQYRHMIPNESCKNHPDIIKK